MKKFICQPQEVKENESVEALLGEKGSSLRAFSVIGLPTPPAFVLTTETYRAWRVAGGQLPAEISAQIPNYMAIMESRTGRKFGDAENPLLVAVRCGVRRGRPMKTILNLGVNDAAAEGLARQTGNARFAYDAYRKLIQMYAVSIKGVQESVFDDALNQMVQAKKKKDVGELLAEDLKALTRQFKSLYREHTGEEFPQDVTRQLREAVQKAFHSWTEPGTMGYRKKARVPEDADISVIIQTMVFGNMGSRSCTACIETRNLTSGEKGIMGEYLPNGQGDEVLMGSRIPKPVPYMEKEMPACYEKLVEAVAKLERYYEDALEIEITVQEGELYFLEARTMPRTKQAAEKIEEDLVQEGIKKNRKKESETNPSKVSTVNKATRASVENTERTGISAGANDSSQGMKGGAISRLKYKTRGTSSPQGKERVFFTCHPADFSIYFDTICEEIFRTQNCAIWYRTNLEEDGNANWSEEEVALDLGQMQLLVIPVTSRFLHQPNRAREVDLKFAKDHHIPVLPLMQERGLESAFNRICGDLQFLDKQTAASDLTAIPYEERLRTFLSSVLLGDELAEKVRNAFDAYIFLSYRKKDRKYAQELMRLIHANSFCRDIAIWYDEFLTPGENFNDAIREAMEKSSLFALTVTPNLVNEINYVMNTEYPEAKKAGMPVLPAELVRTDRKALYDCYPGLPDVMDAHNTGKLSDALLDRLHSIAVEGNDDPKHLYFIGLAYLNGIDMEVNTERAVELITRAAESGLEEAIEKLANMYRRGDGVVRNYEQTIRWQKRLVAARKKYFEAIPTNINALKYFEAMAVLSDDAWSRQDLEESKKVCEQMQAFAGKNLEGAVAKEFAYYTALCFYQLGAICHVEGNLPQAISYYERAMDVAAQQGETGDRFWYICCEKKAEALLDKGDMAGAQTYYEKSMEKCEQIVQQGQKEVDRGYLGYIYYRVAGLYLQLRILAKSEEYYGKSLSVRQRLAEETRGLQDNINLAKSWYGYGRLYLVMKKLPEAEKALAKALNLQTMLAESGETNIWVTRDRSSTLWVLAEVASAKKDYVMARQFSLEALKERESMAEQSTAEDFAALLTESLRQMCTICRKENKLSEAKKYGERALEIQSKVAEKTENVETIHMLYVICDELGLIYQEEENFTRANELFQQAYQIIKSLSGKIVRATELSCLEKCSRRLGDLRRKEGKTAQAWEYFTESLHYSEVLAKETKTDDNFRNLAAVYLTLSMVAQSDGKVEVAEKLKTAEIRLCENMGCSYDRGNGAPQNYSRAAWWFYEAAKQGSVLAIYNLGVYFLNGYGIEKNVQVAAEYMLKAAQAGYAKAQDLIGYYYKIGQGVPKDEHKAAFWFGRAAEQGVLTSMYEFSLCCEYGRGVPKDMKQALAWLTKAAESGYDQAQFRLGTWYHDGIDGPRDYEKAAQWYLKAALQGNEKAKKYLKEAVDKMGVGKKGRWRKIMREKGLE